MKTAKQAGLALCPQCHKVYTLKAQPQQCTRCHGRFYQRKRNSLQYTLAWNIAALLAFIPANLYPIMIVYQLGIPKEATILSGIGDFIDHGLYPIAVIIFSASGGVKFQHSNKNYKKRLDKQKIIEQAKKAIQIKE